MGETIRPDDLPPDIGVAPIEGLYDVRPGDLCFTRIGGFVPGVVPVGAGMLAIGERVRIGPLRFDHVIVVTRAARRLSAADAPFGRPLLADPVGNLYLPPIGVQAMPRGAERVALGPRHWNEWTAYARLAEDYPGQAGDAARIAETMADARIPYSFGSYAMLAAWRWGIKATWLERRIDRRLPAKRIALPSGHHETYPMLELPAEAICSVLADQAWSLAGRRVIEGVAPQAVTPGKLGMSLLARRGRVTWGGPAFSG